MKLVALAAIIAALLVPSALAATPTLTGTVGPGFTITLKKGTAKVTKLKAGSYVIKVSDKSSIHNFRLKGPGVNKATTVGGTGTSTWKVTRTRAAPAVIGGIPRSSKRASERQSLTRSRSPWTT